MGWMFAQLWVWLLLAFLAGSGLAVLVLRVVLPTVEQVVGLDRRRAPAPPAGGHR